MNRIKDKIQSSKLYKDSFWAVFGNGFGNGLLLLAGIIIARFLGKDLYGEYGIVKTTMFYIASFATFGMGFTSTKFVAMAIQNNAKRLRSIIQGSLLISLSFSCLVAVVIFLFARELSIYLEEESLELPFKALSIVIIFKAMSTTQIGIMAGFKEFKAIAYNSLVSGVFLLLSCVPLTYYFGLKGSLIALLASQFVNVVINYIVVYKLIRHLECQEDGSCIKELLFFSFPVALQESSFTVCNWLSILFLSKMASLGDLGVYSASAQWSTIVLMIPSLLSNVVLSHLSGTLSDEKSHHFIMKRMTLSNFVCTFIPFVFVYILAGYISNFYGESFVEMPSVLRILTFATIFEACSSVFKSELMAQGKPWILFVVRFVRDLILVFFVYISLSQSSGENGALLYSWAILVASVFFFFLSMGACKYVLSTSKRKS